MSCSSTEGRMICLGSWVGWDGQMCGITEVSQEAARGHPANRLVTMNVLIMSSPVC